MKLPSWRRATLLVQRYGDFGGDGYLGLGDLAGEGADRDTGRGRLDEGFGKFGVSFLIGDEAVGVGALDNEDYRGLVAGQASGAQTEEMFAAAAGGCIGELGQAIFYQGD